MKTVKLQIKVKVPNNYQLNDSNDILSLLYDFPHNIVFVDGKII